jgi:hypothetical protein
MSQNDKKEWKSKIHDLERCKEVSQRFHRHLVNYRLDGSSNPNAIRIGDSKFLPPNSLVLSGKEVFTIFFEGTTFCDTTSSGEVIECDLKNDWDVVALAFENALQDIAELSNNQLKTSIEAWFDTLKLVMRLYETSELANSKSDADDFYVFLYDEEDK